MAEIISLRKARKKMKRVDESRRSALNRAASGRSKNERLLERARAEKAQRNLDSHHIERKDGA